MIKYLTSKLKPGSQVVPTPTEYLMNEESITDTTDIPKRIYHYQIKLIAIIKLRITIEMDVINSSQQLPPALAYNTPTPKVLSHMIVMLKIQFEVQISIVMAKAPKKLTKTQLTQDIQFTSIPKEKLQKKATSTFEFEIQKQIELEQPSRPVNTVVSTVVDTNVNQHTNIHYEGDPNEGEAVISKKVHTDSTITPTVSIKPIAMPATAILVSSDPLPVQDIAYADEVQPMIAVKRPLYAPVLKAAPTQDYYVEPVQDYAYPSPPLMATSIDTPQPVLAPYALDSSPMVLQSASDMPVLRAEPDKTDILTAQPATKQQYLRTAAKPALAY